MKYKIKTIISILLLFGIFVSVTNVQGDTLGVMPSYIIIKDALRGAEPYQEVMYIDNTLNNENHTFKLNVTGDILGWITFYEPSNATKPITSTFLRNNSYKMIICNISIPGYAANGLYNGTIEVSAIKDKVNETTQNTSQVELILPILVSINVTGIQNVNLTVTETRIQEVEINFPSQISVQFKNSGNVRASPVVKVIIRKDTFYIDEISSSNYQFQGILPGTINTYTMDWNTTGKSAGDYNANFTVTLGDKVIYQKDVDFSLFPPGTFTRNGTIKSITYQGDLKKGTKLKIISTFLNTGEVDTYAKFLGEVYRDDQLIGTLESEEKIVRKFQEKTFESYLNLTEDGSYQVRGHFLYEGKETSTEEWDFTVGDTFNNFYLIILVVAVVCGVACGGLYLRRKKRNKKTEPAKEEPTIAPISKRKTKVKAKKKIRIRWNKKGKPPNSKSKRRNN